MNEIIPNNQSYSGQSIEDVIIDRNPDTNLDEFLTNEIGINETEASIIAESVREARVVIAQSDAAALSLASVPEHDGGASRLIDIYLPSPEKIVVRSGMVELIRHTLNKNTPGIYNLSGEQIHQAGTDIAAIYELGEFVSRKVYDLLIREFRTIERPIPFSRAEADSFYSQVLEDLESRYPGGTLQDHEPSEEALAVYFRQTRPLRFCAAGGWKLVNRVDEQINTVTLQKALRSYQYDKMLEESILPSENLGSLYPLELSEFELLSSFIRGTDKATPIDRFS